MLAMIGGIADMVPVANEFRVIVRSALKVMNGAGTVPVGIAALLRAAGAEPPYRADVSGFTISPRINAAGRIGDAAPALALLTTDDPAEAAELATLLEGINLERKELTKVAIDEALALLGLATGSSRDDTRAFLGDGLVAVRGPWSVGLIGLIAGRLSEETGRPALVAHDDGSSAPLRASIRAPKGFGVAAALQEASDPADSTWRSRRCGRLFVCGGGMGQPSSEAELYLRRSGQGAHIRVDSGSRSTDWQPLSD